MNAAFPETMVKDTLSGIVLTALICSIAVSIPVIGFFALLLLPQPVILYRLRLGRRQGLIIVGAAMALIVLLAGKTFADALFLLAMLGLGFFMGEFIERRLSVEKTIGYACAAVLAGGLFLLAVYAGSPGTGIREMLSDYIAENLRATITLYEDTGVPKETILVFKESIASITRAVIGMLPSLAAAGLLFAGWVNLLTARRLLSRWKPVYADFGDLNLWKSPDFLVWAVTGTIALLLLPGHTTKLLGLNGLVVLMMIYFFQGIAVTSFYFEKKRVPLLLRAMVYVLIAVQQIFLLLVVAIGFFDVWANFRRLGSLPPDGAGQ
ncbi:MAG: YybS family protein [Desulfosalsimonadaceae bacterium]